jgi:hypothetical protein
MHRYVVTLMIDCWNVQIIPDNSFIVVELVTLGAAEDSLYVEFFMDEKVLLRVFGFSAASMLLINIDPASLSGPWRMHCISSGKRLRRGAWKLCLGRE